MVQTPDQWLWSSYTATAVPERAPPWLETDWLLSVLAKSRSEAVEAYVRFVAQGIDRTSPWQHLKDALFLGSDAFADALRRKIPKDRDLRELPQARARPTPQSLDHYAQNSHTRDAAIAAAYASGGYTLKEIGNHFGLHYSRVSKIVNATENGKQKAKEKT